MQLKNLLFLLALISGLWADPLQFSAGLSGETGWQLLALHCFGGPAVELRDNHLFTTIKGGRLFYSYPTGFSLYPLPSEASSGHGWYSGWATEVTVGWELSFRNGCLTQGLRVFGGISPSWMWVELYDYERLEEYWGWETSWAIHLGISTATMRDPELKCVSGNVYWIGWLDTDFVAHEPVGEFTHMTPFGLGANLWLFNWDSKNSGREQENQGEE